MSDIVELKRLVKQLQSPSTAQVRANVHLCRVHVFSLLANAFPQELLGILTLLKKNWEVNETILRVGVARPPPQLRLFMFGHPGK